MTDILQMIKEKIKEVQQNPGALFGLLYPYLLVILVALGLYYASNLDFIARQTVPAFLPEVTVDSDLSIQPARSVPPINILDYASANDEIIAEGEKLYKANCSSCHGENGAGGGPAAMGLNPAPKNFTDNQNWKNGATLSGIYTTLEEGIAGGAMLAYDYLLPVEKISLAHYIRESFLTDKPEDSQSDLEALDLTYNLSAGQQLPAQIPVASAKLILLKENELKTNTIENIVGNINQDNSRGASIFKSVSKNPVKSISFLVKNNGWKQFERNFIDFVSNNVNTNGFDSGIFRLTSDEWSLLYSYLNNNINL
ncbi:MAG: c-type cytochrome [Ignavibacterium sp.]|nr:c-type cytochrome [Ignavibacterium sp.]